MAQDFEGSPPPMRGKVAQIQAYDLYNRITPAYAGKSFLSTFRAFCNQDHPRLCGEKSFEQFRTFCVKGSPPPMRGKEALYSAVQRGDRITPAYAGKSTMPV